MFCKNKVENNTSKILFPLLIGFVSIILVCLPSIHVDEGWFHNIAYSLKINGYPSFNAFSDVPMLKGYYGQGGGIMVKLMGIFTSLPIADALTILLLRVFLTLFFLITIWEFLKTYIKDKHQINLIFAIVLFNPLVIGILSKARSESLMTSLAMWMIMLLGGDKVSKKGVLSALLISYIMMTLHPNGLISLLFIGLVVLIKRFDLRFKIMVFLTLMALFIYMYFNQIKFVFFPDESILSAQYSGLFFAGEEQKLLTSIKDLPIFLFNELKRYPYPKLVPWRTSIVNTILVTGHIVLAWIAVFKNRIKFSNTSVLWGISVFAVFIFLGQKVSLYLVYFLPFVVLAAYSLIESFEVRTKKIYFITVFGLSALSVIASIPHSMANKKNMIKIVDHQQSLDYDIVYAPLQFSPYLSEECMYATNHKISNELLEPYMIVSDKILLIDRKNSEMEKLFDNYQCTSHKTFRTLEVKLFEIK